jgi:hypothetical protein
MYFDERINTFMCILANAMAFVELEVELVLRDPLFQDDDLPF